MRCTEVTGTIDWMEPEGMTSSSAGRGLIQFTGETMAICSMAIEAATDFFGQRKLDSLDGGPHEDLCDGGEPKHDQAGDGDEALATTCEHIQERPSVPNRIRQRLIHNS